MYYPMYYPYLPMYLIYYPFHVLSFTCIILAFLCITLAPLRCLHMYYPCLSAQHKVCGDLINKVTYTATVEQKRLRCFTCCLLLTLFRVTLFNLRLFITIPQYCGEVMASTRWCASSRHEVVMCSWQSRGGDKQKQVAVCKWHWWWCGE
jgi:hypothetical protein